jgi:hypothetical protein
MTRARTAPVALTIERLVLDGFNLTRAQGVAVQRAIEHELAQLFTQPTHAAPWSSGSVPSVPATNLRVAAAPHPTQLGREVAHSAFATLRSAP